MSFCKKRGNKQVKESGESKKHSNLNLNSQRVIRTCVTILSICLVGAIIFSNTLLSTPESSVNTHLSGSGQNSLSAADGTQATDGNLLGKISADIDNILETYASPSTTEQQPLSDYFPEPLDFLNRGDLELVAPSVSPTNLPDLTDLEPKPTSTPTPTPTPTPPTLPLTHTVTGDNDGSYWRLAKLYYDDPLYAALILHANGLERTDYVMIGQQLRIPAVSEYSDEEREALIYVFAHPTPTPTPSPRPTPVPKAPVANKAPAQNNGNPNNPGGLSDEDLDLYLKIIAAEAGGAWEYEGIRMLADVIVNRARRSNISIRAVITAPGQFSPWTKGTWKRRTPSATVRRAGIDSLLGKDRYVAENVYYFCTKEAYARSSWFKTLKHAATYRNVMFFAVR